MSGASNMARSISATPAGGSASSFTVSARPDRRQDWRTGASGCRRWSSSALYVTTRSAESAVSRRARWSTSSRVEASAQWMSSTTSSTGCLSDARASSETTASKRRSFACAGPGSVPAAFRRRAAGRAARARGAPARAGHQSRRRRGRKVVADRLDEREIRQRELGFAAASPEHGTSELARARRELGRESRLTHARVAGDRHKAALTPVSSQQRVLEHGELFVTADEDRTEDALDHAADCHRRWPGEVLPVRHGRWGREDSNLRRLSRRFTDRSFWPLGHSPVPRKV